MIILLVTQDQHAEVILESSFLPNVAKATRAPPMQRVNAVPPFHAHYHSPDMTANLEPCNSIFNWFPAPRLFTEVIYAPISVLPGQNANSALQFHSDQVVSKGPKWICFLPLTNSQNNSFQLKLAFYTDQVKKAKLGLRAGDRHSPISAVTIVDWFSGMEREVWSWSMLRESSLTSCWLWLSSDRSSEYSSSSLRKKDSQPALAQNARQSLEIMFFEDETEIFRRKTGRCFNPLTEARVPLGLNRWSHLWEASM